MIEEDDLLDDYEFLSNREKITQRQFEYLVHLVDYFDLGMHERMLVFNYLIDKHKMIAHLTKNEATIIISHLEDLKKKHKYSASFARKVLLDEVEKKVGTKKVEKTNESVSGVRETEETKVVNEKENSTMKFKNLFGGEIGKDKSGMFKMSALGLAVKNEEGNYVCYNGSNMVDVLDMTVDMDNIVYKIPVQKVEKGDLIMSNGKPVYVKKVNGNELTVFNPFNNRKESYIPQTNLFGFNFFIKVVSLFDLSKPTDGSQGMTFNPMFLAFADREEGDKNDMSEIMMMSMMMQGGNQQNNQFNNMLPFMMMSKGENSNLMEMMMMQQMMGGQGFNFNPFNQPVDNNEQ
ncbi:gp39 [Bacillus phage G]|uniref:Gp39 n=1 Tax=Bacillus phage G TaxID=2884420 RepID=G3MBA9_9CAUD|nr:gp39 [Bacillus phage G]AEO93310.1 gp39 [Bacillus phage G]